MPSEEHTTMFLSPIEFDSCQVQTVLNWTPYNKHREFYQEYQKKMLLCTSLRKVGRLGRRLGKTEVAVIDSLHFANTEEEENMIVLIIGPFQNIIDEIFERIDNLLGSEESAYTKEVDYKVKQQPHVVTIKKNNIKIKGFSAGSRNNSGGVSLRGQRCNKLVLDELAYFSHKDIEAIYAFANERKELEIFGISTPSALTTHFKEWCLINQGWVEFHYSSKILPDFEAKEEEFRNVYTEEGYKYEILAEFFEGSGKVFKDKYVEAALIEYRYVDHIDKLLDEKNWRVIIGVDWNEWKNGVQIVVLGFNLKNKKYRILNRITLNEANIPEGEFLQLKAVRTIIEMDENFRSEFIFVDKGYGATQIEILSQYYGDKGEADKVVSVDFNSNYTVPNPFNGKTITRRTKGVMVDILKKRLEFGKIEISYLEEGKLTSNDKKAQKLTAQMKFYEISHYDNRDNPVFVSVADHILDAFLVAMFGFAQRMEQILTINGSISVVPKTSLDKQLENSLGKTVEESMYEKISRRERIGYAKDLEVINQKFNTTSQDELLNPKKTKIKVFNKKSNKKFNFGRTKI